MLNTVKKFKDLENSRKATQKFIFTDKGNDMFDSILNNANNKYFNQLVEGNFEHDKKDIKNVAEKYIKLTECDGTNIEKLQCAKNLEQSITCFCGRYFKPIKDNTPVFKCITKGNDGENFKRGLQLGTLYNGSLKDFYRNMLYFIIFIGFGEGYNLNEIAENVKEATKEKDTKAKTAKKGEKPVDTENTGTTDTTPSEKKELYVMDAKDYKLLCALFAMQDNTSNPHAEKIGELLRKARKI